MRVKSYCGFHLLRASVFNFEHHDILRDLIRHWRKKLLSLEFATKFRFQLRASWYSTGHNRTSESKVIVVWVCSKLLFSISRVSIYYNTQSDIRVKSYCCLNFLRASIFNYECLNILQDSIERPSHKILSLEFAQSYWFQFRASRYIRRLNRTCELKVIVVFICYELPFSILSITIYYGT